MSTPFLDLVNNLGGFKINVKGYDLTMYQKHLKNMLLRLNTYFSKNNLFIANDYTMLTNLLVNNYSYTFETNKNLPDKTRGRFMKSVGISTGKVVLNDNYFYNGAETEGYLCHEFIHLISTGLDFITYKIENGMVEIVVPDAHGLSAGYKKTFINGQKPTTEILRYSDLGENNFIKEGLTEKLKQQIYGKKDCPFTYHVETNFVELLNFISNLDLRDCFIEFLRGDLETYKKVLTKNVFYKMQSELKLHSHSDENYKDSEHYKNAIAIVVEAGCRQFDKTRPTVEKFIKNINLFSSKLLAFDKDVMYNATIDYATKAFNKTVSKNKTKTAEFQKEYKKFIDLKNQEMWYKNSANNKKGFKLWGLSEEIFFGPNYNGNAPATASMHDLDLTPCLIPDRVGHTTVFSSGNNKEKIFISRTSSNSIKFVQDNICRVVVFADDVVKVLDEHDEVIEIGNLNNYKNAELKHDLVEEQTEKIMSFVNRCLKEKENLDKEDVEGKDESIVNVDENSQKITEVVYDDFFEE